MEEERMKSPRYFKRIRRALSEIEDASWADQDRIKLLKMDIRILEMFRKWLREKKVSIREENEESMERLRSVITHLELIWPKYFIFLCISNFDSVMCELEAYVLQSKRLIKGWCRNLIHSSMMQCKSADFLQAIVTEYLFLGYGILLFYDFNELHENLMLSGYRSGKIVPLKKQFDILGAKIEFLERNVIEVTHCKDRDEILQILDFVGHFTSSVTCIICLYWAKEDGDDEMNIVLFNMLHKFIPYAYDIAPLCVGFLKAYDPRLASDSILLEEAVESFVDFFFEHLATVLKDDFLFLRDRLVFLFTFLSADPPPYENAKEVDVIRSQIYDIWHEDVYLHLSFDEMKEDFSDKKALLSGFMTRIDIAIAKIRQLNCGSSDSWFTVEVEKMGYGYIVSVHRELSSLDKYVHGVLKGQIQLYKTELRFLRVFLLRLASTWDDDTDEEIKVKLRSVITSFRGIWGEKEEDRLLAHRLHVIRGTGSCITDWHPLAFELQQKIQQSKLEIEAWCVHLLHSSSFQFKTSEILKFLDSILDNLNDLVSCKASEITPFKKQIETLKDKLIFLKDFLELAVDCIHYEELGEFEMFVQAFADDAACLTILYWAKDAANAKSASETSCILSHMLRKIKPATPDVARLYFGALMAIYAQQSDSHMFGQTAFGFVQLFLEDLVAHLKDDEFQILQDNIVFLLTFLNDPPDQNAEELICSRIEVLFWEGLYGLLPFDDTEGGFSGKKVFLNDFMMKIEAVNANIRCIYAKFPDSSLYNFPKVVSPRFLDFLTENLRNLKERMNSDRKYVPFAKYKIIKIEDELASLRPLFVRIFDLQSDLNETWLEVVNVLHLTEHVIMSCMSSLFLFDHPFWYHMAYLSDVIDEIKVVKAKLGMIKLEDIMNNARCLPGSDGFISELAEHGSLSETDEIVVGFEHEAEEIIGMLTRGPKSLDIISIVGMGGLGKTTLAKKIYGSSSVKSKFHVFAFCSVSQDHNATRMLYDIIRDAKGVDGIRRDMTKDELAHELHKCLSRQTYFIVLDDIWNVSSWNEVKSSFPDHQNGSRVMFTTRSREVADKCRINCDPYQLRFLYEVESWELLQKKVFGNGISPPYLHEIGKQIAINCKGLALAVVVIAGLLARTEKSLRWWSEVAQRLAYYLSNEGCMEILELSYKHLPENLKPCLIYLGAFHEDSMISVKHVILLWVAEGFVQESNTKSLEDVATDYFHDLVDRSFIIVGARSSSGGIKTFRVHDLIRDLCQTKCRDGNFFQLNHESAISSSSSDCSVNNHYRVSTLKETDVVIAAGSSRTILFCQGGLVKPWRYGEFPIRKFGPIQVLDLGTLLWEGNDINDINKLTSLIHLRHIDAIFETLDGNSVPSSISNLWNIQSLKLRLELESSLYTIHLPKTFWRMKSLRYVKVVNCILKFPDDGDKLSSDQIMDKVVSFSKPVLSTGKDVKRLLQRLPVVRKLSCVLKKFHVYDESIETLDFYRELESLMLSQLLTRRQYTINFPSTLKKLTLERFLLPRTTLSAIADLHCLQVLKLRRGSFVGLRLETEDLVFRNVKFFELVDKSLVEWNASGESFPCLEQVEIECGKLEELPPCFGEMSTLKRIVVKNSPEAESWALEIQEELMELGIQFELSIQY